MADDSACMSVYRGSARHLHQLMVSGPLGLEIQMFVNSHASAGKKIWDCWKSSVLSC